MTPSFKQPLVAALVAAQLLAPMFAQAASPYEMRKPVPRLKVSTTPSPTPEDPTPPQDPTPPDEPTAPLMQASTAALSFDQVLVDATSPVQTVLVTNAGTASGSVTSIQVTGAGADQFAATHDCLAPLAAGTGSCHVSVTFKPASDSPASATLTISTSSGDLTVGLSGQSYLMGFNLNLSSGGGVESYTSTAGQVVNGTASITNSGGALVFTGTTATDTGYVSYANLPGAVMGTRDFVLKVVATRTARNVSGTTYYSGSFAWLGASDPDRIGLWVKDADSTVGAGQFPTLTINGASYHAFDNPITLNTAVTYEVVRAAGRVSLKVNGAVANLYTADSNSAASNRVLVGKTLTNSLSYSSLQTLRLGNAPTANRMWRGSISEASLTVTD